MQLLPSERALENAAMEAETGGGGGKSFLRGITTPRKGKLPEKEEKASRMAVQNGGGRSAGSRAPSRLLSLRKKKIGAAPP